MGKTLVLLAGYPATGKSTFCAHLLKRHPGIPVVAPDDVKEELWDEVGFDTAAEKDRLELRVWEIYYARMEQHMRLGGPIVTDYPFSGKQRPTLSSLVERYGYHAITVRFVGDIDRIYERSLKRDLSQARHLGHLMSHYHKGDYLADRTKADALVTPRTLRDRCIGKGYGLFQMGDLIEVDATDISAIDAQKVIDEIERLADADACRKA